MNQTINPKTKQADGCKNLMLSLTNVITKKTHYRIYLGLMVGMALQICRLRNGCDYKENDYCENKPITEGDSACDGRRTKTFIRNLTLPYFFIRNIDLLIYFSRSKYCHHWQVVPHDIYLLEEKKNRGGRQRWGHVNDKGGVMSTSPPSICFFSISHMLCMTSRTCMHGMAPSARAMAW